MITEISWTDRLFDRKTREVFDYTKQTTLPKKFQELNQGSTESLKHRLSSIENDPFKFHPTKADLKSVRSSICPFVQQAIEMCLKEEGVLSSLNPVMVNRSLLPDLEQDIKCSRDCFNHRRDLTEEPPVLRAIDPSKRANPQCPRCTRCVRPARHTGHCKIVPSKTRLVKRRKLR